MTALVWLLVNVHSLMYYKIGFTSKALFTKNTVIWLLIGVYGLVCCKIIFLNKSLNTMAAMIWHLQSFTLWCSTREDFQVLSPLEDRT